MGREAATQALVFKRFKPNTTRTTRPFPLAEPGLRLAALTPHVFFTQRRCFPMAWCLPRVGPMAVSHLREARNFMIRRAVIGLLPVGSRHAIGIPRRCCPTG